MYWRNLYVSFGLLLLLVTSAVFWLMIGRRVRRLARLEMNFVTSVSHDLRTPITIIASAADNMSRGVVRDQPHVTQYGTVIGTQAKKLSELVEQVLLFASVRKPVTRYALQPVAVQDVIETTLTALDALIRAAGVTIECDIEADLPPVLSDPVGLSQCLQNLITNALKYSGDKKWIGVRAVAAAGGAREVELSVRDHGIGIAAADLRYIFEPFYRSPNVIALKILGTGLGLAVAKTVAETMNSRLTVVSTPGAGSTFTLHFRPPRHRDSREHWLGGDYSNPDVIARSSELTQYSPESRLSIVRCVGVSAFAEARGPLDVGARRQGLTERSLSSLNVRRSASCSPFTIRSTAGDCSPVLRGTSMR